MRLLIKSILSFRRIPILYRIHSNLHLVQRYQSISSMTTPAESSKENITPTESPSGSKEDLPVILGEDGKPLSKGAVKKLLKQQEKERKKLETQARLVRRVFFRMT